MTLNEDRKQTKYGNKRWEHMTHTRQRTDTNLEVVVLTLLHRARTARHVASKHMDPVFSHSVNERKPRSISDALNALALQTS